MQATCGWLRKEENSPVWEAWVPVEKFTCDVGHYVVDATSCAPCLAGSASVGGTSTACMQCSAGAIPLSLQHSRTLTHMDRILRRNERRIVLRASGMQLRYQCVGLADCLPSIQAVH